MGPRILMFFCFMFSKESHGSIVIALRKSWEHSDPTGLFCELWFICCISSCSLQAVKSIFLRTWVLKKSIGIFVF